MPRIKSTIEPDDLDQDLGLDGPPETEGPALPPEAPTIAPDPVQTDRFLDLKAQAEALGKVRNENKVWVSGKAQRCVCVRTCYHPANSLKPETRKLWKVGDEYTAQKGELVPRHFVPRADPRAKDALAGATPDEKAPPFIAKARKITN